MAIKVPAAPSVTVVVRCGKKNDKDLEKQIRELVKPFGDGSIKNTRLEWLAFDHAVLVEKRFICVPDLKVELVEAVLRDCVVKKKKECIKANEKYVDITKGFDVVGRPDGKTFGEDFDYMEHELIGDADFILISDADIYSVIPSERIPFQSLMTPENFWADVLRMTQGMALFGLTFSSIQHQNNKGAKYYGEGMEIQERDTLYHVLGYTKYIRNFFIISKDAKGSWRSVNYLEDRGRALSEIANGGKVSMYTRCVIRYPDPKKAKDRYYNKREWNAENKKLKEIYGNLYKEPTQASSTVHGQTKTRYGKLFKTK